MSSESVDEFGKRDVVAGWMIRPDSAIGHQRMAPHDKDIAYAR
ncbi:hypothetical protein AB0B25_03860 [Nocardia sp. NPDC049190]